jgi:hypothetical protein
MSDETKKEGQQTPDETKPLEASDAALETVAGGSRAGGDRPVKYMKFKLKEVLISGVISDTK